MMRSCKRLLCWGLCWALCGPAAAQMLQWHRVLAPETVPSAMQTMPRVSAYAALDPAAAASAGLTGVRPLSPRALQYTALITEVAQQHAVDPLLVHAVIEAESAYRPAAVSSAGALGLMQVMPATGARFGKTLLTRPRDNVEAGVAYLSWLIQRFDGRLDLALAGYNAGEGAVARHGNAVPPYVETRAYVQKVMGRYASLNGQTTVAIKPPEPVAATATPPETATTATATTATTTTATTATVAVPGTAESASEPPSAHQRMAGSSSDLEQLFRLFIGGPRNVVPPGRPS